MSEYQNCLSHSLQQWSRDNTYKLMYDGNHVFATKESKVGTCIQVNSEDFKHWLAFPLDDDDLELLELYYSKTKKHNKMKTIKFTQDILLHDEEIEVTGIIKSDLPTIEYGHGKHETDNGMSIELTGVFVSVFQKPVNILKSLTEEEKAEIEKQINVEEALDNE